MKLCRYNINEIKLIIINFQLSSDGTPWTDVFAVDTYLREGWNTYTPNSNHHRTFNAEYIYVSTGVFFEAKTETNRHTSKLTITMHRQRNLLNYLLMETKKYLISSSWLIGSNLPSLNYHY